MPNKPVRAAAEGVPITFDDLEAEVYELKQMARILSDLIDSSVFSGNADHILTTEQAEQLAFASDDVEARAVRLDRSFHEALSRHLAAAS
jgi:hypothetical protein